MTPPDYDDLCKRLRMRNTGERYATLDAAADAIESLREQLDVLAQGNTIAVQEKQEQWARAERAEADNAALRQLVAEQAEDDGLWFMAQTAPEAYLQQELRKLHAAIEGDAALLAGKEKP